MATIEEKAKAYDKVREKIALRFGSNVAEEIFSEYEESEDERIRKALLEMVHDTTGDSLWIDYNVHKEDVLSWLEKQGKNSMGISEATKKKLEDNLNKALEKETPESWNEFLDEQKPTDKIEPKFKVGDWVIDKQDIAHQIANVIENVTYHTYGYDIVGGGYFNDNTEGVRLWTIQDAKDGDVLIDKSHARECPFIFKETKPSDIKTDVLNPLTVLGYCGIGGAGFTKGSGWGDTANCTYYPATKEQRDFLFKKMKEAGYEWDAEKKELKKIEQKFTENEELTEFDKAVGVSIGTWNPKTPEQIQLVKVVSKKLLKLAKKQINDEQKTAWSEEDEKNLNEALSYIKDETLKNFIKDRVQPQNIACYNPYKEVVESIAEMCKHYDKASHSGLRDFYDNVKVKCKDAKEYDSLYPQTTWKPSDEQMEMLNEVLNFAANHESSHWNDYIFGILNNLINQLKKLKS